MNDINTPIHLRRAIFRRTLAMGAVAALGLAACGSDDATSSATTVEQTASTGAAELPAGEGITISDTWSRQPADGQTTSAVYGVVTNNTDQDVTAVSATSSVSDQVELHEVSTNDAGQMTMQEKDGGYTIPAGESFTFEPGGAHIMLMGIDAATYPATVDMTLTFDNGETLDFTAEVRAITDDGAMGDHSADDTMGDGSMDHMSTTIAP